MCVKQSVSWVSSNNALMIAGYLEFNALMFNNQSDVVFDILSQLYLYSQLYVKLKITLHLKSGHTAWYKIYKICKI